MHPPGDIRKHFSVIFDGTLQLDEAITLAGSHSALCWRVDTVAMLDLIADTLTSEETARELIHLLSATHGVQSGLLLAAIRDHASVNNSAM